MAHYPALTMPMAMHQTLRLQAVQRRHAAELARIDDAQAAIIRACLSGRLGTKSGKPISLSTLAAIGRALLERDEWPTGPTAPNPERAPHAPAQVVDCASVDSPSEVYEHLTPEP